MGISLLIQEAANGVADSFYNDYDNNEEILHGDDNFIIVIRKILLFMI